jgi:hypothetical protein
LLINGGQSDNPHLPHEKSSVHLPGNAVTEKVVDVMSGDQSCSSQLKQFSQELF